MVGVRRGRGPNSGVMEGQMAFQFDSGEQDTPAPLSTPTSSLQAPLSAPKPLCYQGRPSPQTRSRKVGLQPWLDACEARRVPGERDFDYSLARGNFIKQLSRVRIICNIHQLCFTVRADRHLTQKHGGCAACEGDDTRKCNLKIWLDACEAKHAPGERDFDYSLAQGDFTNQQSPVRIICKIHQLCFTMGAQKHLTQKSGGCAGCERDARIARELPEHSRKFMEWFNENLASRLEMLTPYVRSDVPIQFRCKIHENISSTTPDTLRVPGATGCNQCSRNATIEGKRRTLDNIISKYGYKMPTHVLIKDIIREERELKDGHIKTSLFIIIDCEVHGTQKVTYPYISNKYTYGCPQCGLERKGYTPARLADLLRNPQLDRPTEIGIMTVEVFGIESIKVGITIRTLEERYKWDLRKVHFRWKTTETTAILMENELHRTFRSIADTRVFKAGMRSGQRWGGDTELYFPKHLDRILSFARNLLERYRDGHVDLVDAAKSFEDLPDFNIKVTDRDSLGTIKRIPVVRLDTGEKFASIGEAEKALGLPRSSIRKCIAGLARTTRGIVWCSAEDYEAGNLPSWLNYEEDKSKEIPKVKLPHKRHHRVTCLETMTSYENATDAARHVGGSAMSHGIKISCESFRKGSDYHRTAYGYRWVYAPDYREGLEASKTTALPNGAPRPVVCIETEQVYRSGGEASLALGMHRRAVFGTLNGRIKTCGGFTWRYANEDEIAILYRS